MAGGTDKEELGPMRSAFEAGGTDKEALNHRVNVSSPHRSLILFTSFKKAFACFACYESGVLYCSITTLNCVSGALMLTAWMTLGSLGMMVARYLKRLTKRQKLFGKDVWFLVRLRNYMYMCYRKTFVCIPYFIRLFYLFS